jgi:hypothetical protein
VETLKYCYNGKTLHHSLGRELDAFLLPSIALSTENMLLKRIVAVRSQTSLSHLFIIECSNKNPDVHLLRINGLDELNCLSNNS